MNVTSLGRFLGVGSSLAVALVLASCGGTGSSGTTTTTTTTPPPPAVSVTLNQTSANVAVSGTTQFTATVTNSSNTSVTWSVDGVANGNSTTGTISSSGLYTAPAQPGSHSVTATSVADSSATAKATVAVGLLSLTPSTATINASATQQFDATIQGFTNASVTWSVNQVSGGNSTVGTISASGMYTAPAQGGSYTITATSSADTSVTATATITVKSLTSIAVSPGSASIFAGATQQFAATATYSDGSTANISSTANWTSGTTSIATVNSTGLATGVTPGTATVTASLSGISGTATLTVKAKVVTSISVSPTTWTILTGATQQFSDTATYNDGSTGDVTASTSWSTADQSVATINSSGIATGIASGSTAVMASYLTFTADATAVVSASVGTSVPLWHFDTQRSGLNSSESFLTTSNVNTSTFGKLFSYLVDGYVYGQPLLVSDLTVNGSTHNVLLVATENDSVYAFDADTYGTGAPLWQVSLLQSGETPLTNSPILPFTGITSTPAIDLTTNTMYVVSTQTNANGGTFRLNALDITSGAQKYGGPVTLQASVAGANATTLTTACLQRAALLVVNGSVFIGFGSCHSGWLLAYDEQTLAQTGVFNSSPNLFGEGPYASAGGVWMGGGGPVADTLGNIYVTTGNGPYDGLTAFGDSVLKFTPTLQLLDNFTPDAYAYMNCQDADLAAGGLLLIPGTTEALAGGKTGKLYLVNTTNLGGEQANDAGATQTLWFEDDLSAPYPASCTDSLGTHTTDINSYEIFGTAAYFNGSVYLGTTPTAVGVPAGIRQFTYSGLLTQGAYTANSVDEGSYGTTPFISANGATNGIVWMVDHGQPLQDPNGQSAATLRAYDATNLGGGELYDSGQNPADVPGYGIKFTSPMVANGKVYIGTGHDDVTVPNPQGEVDVYGLKP
jgi:hypothetical protein